MTPVDTDNVRAQDSLSSKGGPKWIGVVLSIFFPCFGFVWAGQYKRAIIWLGSLLLAGTLAIVLLAFEEVPIVPVGIVALIGILIQIASYVKSYQRGSLGHWRWLALLAYGVVFYLSPFPASLFARAFAITTDSM